MYDAQTHFFDSTFFSPIHSLSLTLTTNPNCALLLPRNMGISKSKVLVYLVASLVEEGMATQQSILNAEYHRLANDALRVMEDSIIAYAAGQETPDVLKLGNFADVRTALLLHDDMVHLSDGRGHLEKYFVGPMSIASRGADFILYSAGTGGEANFEEYMSRTLNVSVFAFDCTDVKKSGWTTFQFYPWCIGPTKDLANIVYTKNKETTEFIFKPLAKIKEELKHTSVGMFKFDIEGCEWDILQTDIVEGKDNDLPEQLLFELHTEGANPHYVPAKIVAGKRRREVVKLLYDLYHRNYRIVHYELNAGDKHCMELSLLRVHDVTSDHSWEKIRTVVPYARG